MKQKKGIAILGSTGSIGTQALEVIESHSDKFTLISISAQNNADLLISQAIKFCPQQVVIGRNDLYNTVKQALASYPIEVLVGEEGLSTIVENNNVDIVLTSMVGYAGLIPTIKAIESKKDIALANKETLVVAGEMITKLAEENQVKILPVDSEHSAIFQCLVGESYHAIEKIVLTASGGPFRGENIDFLKNVTKTQALKHPNWSMGAKITIDSASLMNKGLEVIEAKWLFGLDDSQIEVIVHPQSIIHSIVQFRDGSMKAQMGLPDMKLPIQYALGYPTRLQSGFPRFDFMSYPQLTFEQPDIDTFQNLALAYQAMKQGGNMPCIMNAANEVVVEHFLKDGIGFLEMSEVIENCMQTINFVNQPTINDYIETDSLTRIKALAYIKQKN
jgi:1-deoxy-D-xylulose-5-phosphate reductoisomerase